MRKLLLGALMLAFTGPLAAQEAPKAEVYGGYSFANVQLLSSDRPNANGWNASLSVNLNRWFGLVTDFGGLYGASAMTTFTFPCTPPCTPQTVRETFAGKVHTFLVGPRFSWRREKVTPFGHVLVGGARLNSTTTISPVTPPGTPSSFSSSSFTFALALGGGVDYKFRDRWAWRVQADYVQSGFFGATQNNFRLSTGLVFQFGK